MPGDISTNQTLSAPGSKNTKMKGFRTSVSGGNYPTNLFLQNIEKINNNGIINLNKMIYICRQYLKQYIHIYIYIHIIKQIFVLKMENVCFIMYTHAYIYVYGVYVCFYVLDILYVDNVYMLIKND